MRAELSVLLSKDHVRALAPDAYGRGEVYASQGRVQGLHVEPLLASAWVEGTERYRVELRAPAGRLLHSCSCPRGLRGEFCKHCVALALVLEGDGPFETRAQVWSWLRRERLEHLARLCAAVLVPELPAASDVNLRQALARHRLFDVASLEGVRSTGYGVSQLAGRERLPPLAWRFLETERAGQAAACAELPKRLTLPSEPRLVPLVEALLRRRAEFPPTVPPRPTAQLGPDLLRPHAELPGFTFQDGRRYESRDGSGFREPHVELRLEPSRAQTTCSCGEPLCVHALAAVDAALLWLQRPWGDEAAAHLEELLRPSWERSLRALERILADAEAASGVEVSWRLSLHEGYGIQVFPYLHRPSKRGGKTSGARSTPSALLETHRHRLDARDVRIAQLLSGALGPYVSRTLLSELVGHPRVCLDEAPERTVRVERAPVGLVALDRGESVHLTLGLDGTPLPTELLKRLHRGQQDEPHYLWEPGARTLTLLELGREGRAMLDAFGRHGHDFPPESHAALLEKLSLASTRLPVAMPRSVMGDAVPPNNAPVVRLELQPGARVRVELCTRPLPESLAFLPAEGPRDIHVRRGGRLLHAVRDFAVEQQTARALAQGLGLGPLEPSEPFRFELRDIPRALELLGRCATQAPLPELEWRGEPLRVVSSDGARALKVVLDRKRDWFGLLGGLSVEGERVELAVLLDAARRKQRYVEARPHTYVHIEERLREHLGRLADHVYRSSHGLEVGPSAVWAVAGLEELGADVSTDDTWRALALRVFTAQALTPKVPRTLRATLRDYQRDGFAWLSRLASWGAGGVLADDMGLGKTVQALAVLLDRAKSGPALVVAPTSVGFNWVEEAQRFAPSLRLHVYAEAPDRGGLLKKLGPQDVLVLSYGLLSRDVERLGQVSFATVVFDEAQALKNVSTRRARAAQKLRGEFRFALSGTPMENHLGELWSLFRIVFPGLLGSWEAFRSRFATPIEKGIDPTAAPALARVLQPFLLRRTKSQVEQQLPPRTDIRVPVVLSEEEFQLYEDARLAALSELETRSTKLRESQRRVQVLAALTRLRLLASHPRLYDAASEVNSAKLTRLLELVEELLEEGHRALVFSQFTSHLALVREALDARGVPYLYLDGQTPRGERAQRVKAFQAGTASLFLISLKAGGFGLNLTQADYVIHLDPWWNPAVEDQASDRAHRIGQMRPVTVLRLVAKGTIEEKILALHEEKRALVSGVLEGKDEAGKLSTEELVSLLGDAAPLSKEPASAIRH